MRELSRDMAAKALDDLAEYASDLSKLDGPQYLTRLRDQVAARVFADCYRTQGCSAFSAAKEAFSAAEVFMAERKKRIAAEQAAPPGASLPKPPNPDDGSPCP